MPDGKMVAGGVRSTQGDGVAWLTWVNPDVILGQPRWQEEGAR